MNELVSLVREGTPGGSIQKRKGKRCALYHFVGDMDGRCIGWDCAVFLHLGDEREEKNPTIIEMCDDQSISEGILFVRVSCLCPEAVV